MVEGEPMAEINAIEHVKYKLECNSCDEELMLDFDINDEEDRKDLHYFENFIMHNGLSHDQFGIIMDHVPEGCKKLKWFARCFNVIDIYKRIEKGDVNVCCNGHMNISFNKKGQKELEIEDLIKKSGITHGLHEAFEPIRPKECDDITWMLTCSRILGLDKANAGS